MYHPFVKFRYHCTKVVGGMASFYSAIAGGVCAIAGFANAGEHYIR